LIEQAFWLTIARKPTPAEQKVAREVISAGAKTSDTAAREAAFADLFQMLFSSLDFRYRD
jgi:hypothetical protein